MFNFNVLIVKHAASCKTCGCKNNNQQGCLFVPKPNNPILGKNDDLLKSIAEKVNKLEKVFSIMYLPLSKSEITIPKAISYREILKRNLSLSQKNQHQVTICISNINNENLQT